MIATPIPTKIVPYLGPSCPDPAPGSGPPKKQNIPQAIISPAIIHREIEKTLLRITFIFLLYLPNVTSLTGAGSSPPVVARVEHSAFLSILSVELLKRDKGESTILYEVAAKKKPAIKKPRNDND